jgi:hypothetical protein
MNLQYAIFGSLLIIMVGSVGLSQSNALSVGPVTIPDNILAPLVPSTPPTTVQPPQLPTVPLLPPSPLFAFNKVKSGLVASDSLTDEVKNKEQLLANQNYWHYGGSAQVLNAPYDIFKDSQGFHVGVQSLANGEWAGFYGVTPNTDATLFHAVITTDRRTIPSNFYNNGLYVQTAASSNVNYVTCFADTGTAGTVWAIVAATGNTGGATDFKTLWFDPSAGQPLTKDCTIITNGSNYLKVYLDGIKVYENSTMNLQMPGPFNAFLEPQTSYAGEMQYGTYKDYYAASSETVTVTNTPPFSAKVRLVDSSMHVLAEAPVVSDSASLTIGQYHMPLGAFIKVYDSNEIEIASTPSPIGIYGGDTYQVKLNFIP